VHAVVADTGPLHYLVLIEAIELLPRLFGKVLVPEIVRIELGRPRTPAPVRTWLRTNPTWLEQRPMPPGAALLSPKLGEGEQAAIALAHAVGATLILMDDRVGTATARAQGLEATGTLGVLELAAARDLIDLPAALTRLKATNFRYRPELLEILLARHQERRSGS
jgi:predicted nucleic acid-binding protein